MRLYLPWSAFSKTTFYLLAAIISFGVLGSQKVAGQCTGPSGTISVGPTGTYTTLTAAIAAASTTNGISASVIFELQSTYSSSGETFPITFPANTCLSATRTITVRPATGATGLSITSSNSTATIDFNGGDFVTIDGRPGGTGTTSQLTISNTATGAAVAARFINDASNNTITYCSITGSTTSNGVVLFSTGTTTGNDDNIISNNTITAAGSNLPINGIHSVGTSAAIDNSGNTVTGNNISDYFNAGSATNGINVGTGNSTWTISNNRLYQTADRIYTTGNSHNGINIAAGGGYTITGNTIGYASATSTGTTNLIGNSAALTGTFPSAYTVSGTANATRFTGINCAFTAGSAVSSIQNNTISGFALYTSLGTASTTGIFCGIAVSTGAVNIGTTTGNTIGSATGTGSIYAATTTTGGIVVGIYTGSSNAVAIRNNTIGAIDAVGTSSSVCGGINGINIAGTSSSYDVSGNTIGNATNPNLRMGNLNDASGNLSNSASAVFGIATGTALFNGILSSQTGTGTIGTVALPNTIRNVSLNSSSSGTSIRGITASGAPTITSNQINNLASQTTNTGLSSTLLAGMGIFLNSITTTGAVVTKNTIHTLSLNNTTTSGTNITGIAIYAGTSEISYNKIYNIINASTSTTAATPGTASGMFLRQPGGVQSIFNNMISLGNAQSTNTSFLGIWMQNSAVPYNMNCYFNSINIEGTVSSGAQPSFAFLRGSFSATTVVIPVDIRNNVFVNTRSGSTSKNYAIGNCYGGTAVNTGWGINASNFNVLNAASSTIGYWSSDQTFSGWQAASGSDANSMSGVTVPFVATATADLHVTFGTTPTRLESGGVAIPGIAVDFDGQARPGPTGSVNGGSCVDIGADEFDGVPLDLTGPYVTFTALTNVSCIVPATRLLTPVTIQDCNGINTTTGTKPRVYYKKSTDANTYAGNTSADNGWKYVEASNSTSPFSFTIDYSILQSAVAPGDVIQYFVVAQDLNTTPNVGISGGVFTANPTSVALTSAAFPISGAAITSFTINAPGLAGSVTIGATGTYTSLTGTTGLFNALNTQGVAGNVTATIIDVSVTETGAVALNSLLTTGCTPGTYSLTIKPQTGTAVTLTGSVASGLIKINGADNVTIDGLNTAGASLKITNTNTAGSIIWLASAGTTDGATNDTIRNCVLAGVSGTTTIGGIIAGSGTTLGNPADAPNSNNAIIGNTFLAAQNGIYISGHTTLFDQNWYINGNTFGSVTTADKLGFRGLSVQSVNSFNISNNTINGVISASASIATGISIFGTSTNGNIFRNKISDIKNTSTAGAGCNGIALAGTPTAANISVYNNFVSDVAGFGFNGYASTDNGYGIILISGGGYSIYHNTVLMNTDQSLTTGNPAAMNITSGITTSNSVNIRDNIFANIQTVGTNRYAILSTATAIVYADINYNDYWAGSSANLGYFNGNIATLSAWRTATGKDLQSLNVAPVFIAATAPADLHLSNAPGVNWCLNGAGVAIAGITTDIDAQTRSTTPDIGADEFNVTDNTVATPSTQAVCSGTTASIALSGAGGFYTWTRDNTVTVTGMPASGTGNISGLLTNTTSAPVTVTFTITPTNANSCVFGSTVTATIVVNPIPDATATPSSQTICSGATIITIVNSGSVAGTVFNWTRDNTASVTGIAASGAGNISGSLTNATSAPLPVTFSITPAYTNAGTTCTGTATTAIVTVNPTNAATLTSAAGTNAQTVCINTAISNITYSTITATGATFSGLPTGVTGNWAANVITISGTPTVSGTFNYTVTLTGGCGTSVTATGSITVTPNNTIALSSVAGTNAQSVCINTPIGNITYNTTTATGATFSGLPTGVTGAWAGNVVTISGTPTVSGTFSYTVTLTGGCGTTTSTGTITVAPTNTVTLTSSGGSVVQSICVNTPITNITYATTGATGATFTGLPAGVTGSWAGNVATISGTPTALGSNTYTVTLTGGCGTVTATGTITVINANTVALSSGAGSNSQAVCINNPITNITYTTAGASGATATGLPTGVGIVWAANVITISGTPTVAGTFNYTVTLTGGCGSTVTTTGTIISTANNTATLSSAAGTNAQTLCINTPITNITYTSSGATGATFSGLPAGVSGVKVGNVITISGTPTVSGTFIYTITLTGGCGTATVGGTITVTPNNTITLSSAAGTNAQTVCINTPLTTINYTTTGATGATFAGLPTGVTGSRVGNLITISGTPSVSGTFSYTVTLSGGCGTVSATGSITVTANNTIALSSAAGTNAQTRCQNTPITNITYNVTGTTGATFTGLPTGVTGVKVGNVVTISGAPTVSGTFNYTVTITGGCGLVTATGTIIVNPLPGVSISPTTATICFGGNITLTASGASTYAWSPTNGLSATTGTSVVASPVTTITYTVTGTDANGCVNTANRQVTVNALPNVFITPGGTISFCQGLSTTLNAFGAVTYAWTPSTGLSATTGSSVIASPPSTTTYTVTGTGTNGCTNTATKTVNIIPAPDPTITPAGYTDICQDDTVYFTSTSGYASYVWMLYGVPISGAVSNNFQTTTGGFYTLKVTDATGCTSTTPSPSVITVTQHPLPVITRVGFTLDAGAGFATYQWYLNGTIIAGANSRTYTPTVNGTYMVAVTDGTPLHCPGNSESVVFKAVGVTGTSIANAIRLYPNPASDMVNIDAPVQVNVTVSSMDGKEVFSGIDIRRINIGAFADGIYRVLITDKNGTYLKTEKITKVSR